MKRNQAFTRELKATMLAASLLGAVILAATMTVDGCGAADEIFDCQSVCQRYHDCYDSGYDVGACRQQCRDNSESNPSIRQDADQCEACIGDKSCLSATFQCADPCAHIVP